jgi:hypothetical protein
MDRRTSPTHGQVVDNQIVKPRKAQPCRFGAHLRQLHQARGLTQEPLAQRTRLAPNTIEFAVFDNQCEVVQELRR